jgi:hypothetical protein
MLLAEPCVLGVAVMVLGRTKGVGHALDAVYNRTGKVVRGVNPVGKCEAIWKMP